MGLLHVAGRPLVETGFGNVARTQVSAVFDTSGLNTNSLVTGLMNLGYAANQYNGLYTPTITQETDPTDGLLAHVNTGAVSPTYGTVYEAFTLPTGCTSVTLKIKIKLPVGATPNTIRLGLFTPAFDAFVDGFTLTPAPSSTLTEYTHTYTGLTAGATYFVIANFNYPSQSDCLVKIVEVIPASADGPVFSGPFYRLACDARNALYDALPDHWWVAGGPEGAHRAGTNTRWGVISDATDYVIDYAVSSTSFPDYAGIVIRVDGVVAEVVLPGSTGRHRHAFSVSAGRHRVEVSIPPLWKGDVPGEGGFPLALYVGPCTTLQLAGPANPAAPRVLFVGGSDICGYYGNAGKGFLEVLTDAGRIQALTRACAGQSLHDTCADNAAADAYVASLASVTFDRLWYAAGANDALTTTFGSVGAYETALAYFLDAFHTAFPSKPVYVMGPLSWVHSDSVVDPYRTAASNICATRVWTTYVHGPDLLDVSVPANYVDDYHPAPIAHETILPNAVGAVMGV